jgi:hypothetical protein
MRVEQLAAGQHSYFCEKSGALETSLSGSLFVLLQNEAGRARFELRDAAVAEIIRSMGANIQLSNEPQLINPISFATTEFAAPKEPSAAPPGGYFDSRPAPVSPIPQQSVSSDFGAIGGTTITNAFAAAPTSGRRGRWFDLVDDGEEDNYNDVDVVSGMLGNLNVDLFQNTMVQDVDIEAISLMGIGVPPPPGGGLQPRSSRGRFG